MKHKTLVYMQGSRQRRDYTKRQLNAWLDAQEQIVREQALPDELVEEFDPLYNLQHPREQLHQVYERGEHAVEQGRRTILFRFNLNLESSIADQIQSKIVERVKSHFMLKISTEVELRNIADGKKLSYYQTIGDSPWLDTLTASKNWVKQQEELRFENQRRPNTQWAYEKTLMIYVKVILDRQPLRIGFGRLPDWLRNKKRVIPLDTFRDNLCLFRCIAVHWGAHVRRNIRRTRELAEAFFAQHPGLRNRLTDRHLPLLEKHFKQGIAAYTVHPNGDFVLTHLPANYDKIGRPVLTMGIYEGHAFLILDIKTVTHNYNCGDCQARFTKSCHLVRHASRCTGGQTKINCPNKRISAPASAYERAFYPDNRCSFIATKWLEWEAKQRDIHIHHARCGHGGERYIFNVPVGYHPGTNTVFQYHGCLWHGCRQCYPTPAERQEVIRMDRGRAITRKVAYGLTLQRAQHLRDAGYTVVEKWEHEAPAPWANTRCPEKQTETYPHAIGPSLVFTRKHVAGETKIRSHQYEDARLTKRILGYDANSLDPSTMMKEMPCGEGVVTTYANPEAAARVFPTALSSGEWFGFAEVDIVIPEELWPEFEEFPPLFINAAFPTTRYHSTCTTTCYTASESASLSSRSSWGSCQRRRSSCTPPSCSGTSTMDSRSPQSTAPSTTSRERSSSGL